MLAVMLHQTLAMQAQARHRPTLCRTLGRVTACHSSNSLLDTLQVQLRGIMMEGLPVVTSPFLGAMWRQLEALARHRLGSVKVGEEDIQEAMVDLWTLMATMLMTTLEDL